MVYMEELPISEVGFFFDFHNQALRSQFFSKSSMLSPSATVERRLRGLPFHHVIDSSLSPTVLMVFQIVRYARKSAVSDVTVRIIIKIAEKCKNKALNRVEDAEKRASVG